MKSTSIKKALPGLLVCMVLFTGCRGKSGSTEPLPWIPETLAAATEFINKNCPEMIDNLRLNSKLSMHRDNSVIFVFNYRDREGILITEFSGGPELYR